MAEIQMEESLVLATKEIEEEGVRKIEGRWVASRNIANTPENIEAIKDAARDAIEAHHKAKRAEGVLWKDIDDVDAILWVLGLTGDRNEV